MTARRTKSGRLNRRVRQHGPFCPQCDEPRLELKWRESTEEAYRIEEYYYVCTGCKAVSTTEEVEKANR